jgi:hypothetical protein
MSDRIAVSTAAAALRAALCVVLTTFAPTRADDLEHSFRNPPPATKPWVYWYWISDNISRDGITRDLEAMARAGIGEALIGNIFLDEIPAGRIKVLSEPWWDLVTHAIREGGRVGVDIGMFNCPGWSQSGGPWIRPEQAMRYLAASELRVTGPAHIERQLDTPAAPLQTVAVLAFRSPLDDAVSLASRHPHLTSQPAATNLDNLIDGRTDTLLPFPPNAGRGAGTFTLDIALDSPFTARTLVLTPGPTPWSAQVTVQAIGDAGQPRTVRTFPFDRSNHAIGVGPMPRGPVTITFPSTTARRFRLVFSAVNGDPTLAEADLTPAARVESFVEKQLGKMHPTPLPLWDAYRWPQPAEPDIPDLALQTNRIVNLTSRTDPSGILRWDVPQGDWVIQRIGMTPTGTRNSPASPEGQGLEVDKMNPVAARAHFQAFIGEALRRIPARDRKALKHIVADSYEMGSQNWTDGFADTFRQRYGYDPLPWLPVLSGRIVESADLADRFLWDLRRLVADHVATDYVGALRQLCHENNLELWLENYGHWGFPAEFLQYGGQSDRVGGEFWVTGDLGSIECRAASSCANTYGRPVVSAEAFTGGPAFQTAPSGLKARGDWAWSEGINHFVLHVCIHQPDQDRFPGINAWFGTEFNRHNTWFEPASAWIDYLRRSCALLQQGTRVADVAYFIGEDTPKMTGIRNPPLPPGYDFDYLNAEILVDKLDTANDRLVLPHGTSYRVLVLPPQSTLRPAVARKIATLIRNGATVVGPRPDRSPSLEHYPACDAEVRRITTEVWGAPTDGTATAPAPRPYGSGRVIPTADLQTFLTESGAGPDFESSVPLRFTHRRSGDTDIYFVANPKPQTLTTAVAFRVANKTPELWWPDSGRIERLALFHPAGNTVRLPLTLGPHGSVFVVFRSPVPPKANYAVAVTRAGTPILDARSAPTAAPAPANPNTITNNFTFAVWARPEADTTLVTESNRGVQGMAEPRNDALFPPHGDTFGTGNRAGAGLAIGRNGVCVFEHGANYFAPVLVHPTPIDAWTHIAIVYRDGQPSLYLDGRPTHTGLRSARAVHPGTGSASGSRFRGILGPFDLIPNPLTDADVAALAKTMPRPDSPAPAVQAQLLFDDHHHVQARLLDASPFDIEWADGHRSQVQTDPFPAQTRIDGPWDVEFDPQRGGPGLVKFDTLASWTQRSEPGVRNYSGTARYSYRFTWSPPPADARRPLLTVLDLGRVHDLAIVRLNGQTLGTLWQPPWQIDVTPALQPGTNLLTLDIVNTWNNRLAADASLPANQRLTHLAAPTVSATTPLLPAGLLGPVTLRTGQTCPAH